MEAFCIGTFTLEFIARITTTPHINSYFKDFMNVIDVVAIFPFYMEVPPLCSPYPPSHPSILW
jgi:hypothetical protein